MNRISQFALYFLKNSKATAIVFAILLIFGTFAYTNLLKREGFPPVDVPISLVSGRYFVDDQAQVDKDIAQPIVEALKTNDGYKASIDNITTTSGPNFFTAVVEYESGSDTQESTTELADLLEETLTLPSGVELDYLPISASKFNGEYDLVLSVFAIDPKTQTKDLQEAAQAFADEIAASEFIATAEAQELLASAPDPATGQIEEREVSFNRVGVREQSDLNFYPSVIVGLARNGDIDDISLSNEVGELIEGSTFLAENENFSVVATADFADQIRSQVNSLQGNMLTGLIAVILISVLVINLRAALITAIFMGVTIATTFIVLLLIGYSLNTISLFALVLTLGLFVDDATVIVEAIDARKKDKGSTKKIIEKSVYAVGRASVIGTITTLLVFAPLAFVGGVLGDFIRIMPITVISALTVSIIVSLTLLPIISSWILLRPAKNKPEIKRSLANRIEDKIADKLANLIRLLKTKPKVGKRWAIGLGLLSILGLMIGGDYASRVGFDIFPPAKDVDVLQISAEFEPGLGVSGAARITDQINSAIDKTIKDEVTKVAYFIADENELLGQISLTSFNDRDISSSELKSSLDEKIFKIEQATVRVAEVGAGPPSEEFPFKVQVVDENPAVIRSAIADVRGFLQGLEVGPNENIKTEIVETQVEQAPVITRINNERYIEVRARFADDENVSAYVAEAQTAIEDRYQQAKLTSLGLADEGIRTDSGQESDNQESFASAGIAFVVANILILLVLIVQFKSLLQPILILLAIPFSFLGVFAGLYYTDNPLSFFVFIGLTGLVGVVVNNTIMLVDIANRFRREGHDHIEAIALAVKERFRPLVATTLTTVFGLLPLALSDPFWEGLAFTIIFGLISSTFFVILSFPYYYLAVEWLRAKSRRIFKKIRPSRS